jgi:hypothetical protein
VTTYEALLFLHIASVILWLGAGTTLALATASGRLELRHVLGLTQWLGPRLFAPGALGALLFGILLVVNGSWTFGPLWIKLGLVGFALTFLSNTFVRGRTLRRLERDPESETVRRRLALLGLLDLTILYLVVAAMISKPSGADVWTLAIGGAIVLGGLWLAESQRD